MASHGKVLDLLDDRYLKLQDVYGNVQPFPKLVPYEYYSETMLVYRVKGRHEVFVGLLQDFTDRFARKLGKESWSWFMQWEVEKPPAHALNTPTAKRQRTGTQPDVAQKSEPPKPKGPALTVSHRRVLHHELFQEEDILRILIDIVQVESSLVPNYIEYLYQWIDFYEGGGMALKAAVKKEIPSLWLYEFHPLPLFKPGQGENDEEDRFDKAAEKMGERLTRTKPLALAEMENLTEQTERLAYREVKFGIQRPDPADEPLPPLINVPKEYKKREQYYAACYKNRQRAMWILQEAGLTARQVANYKKLQPMNPKDTTEEHDGDGFKNYFHDEPYARRIFVESQLFKELREKQREIAISRRLADEARIAAETNTPSSQSALPPALIPPTPITPRIPDRPSGALASFLTRLHRATKEFDPVVKWVPRMIFDRTKSVVYARALPRPLGRGVAIPVPNQSPGIDDAGNGGGDDNGLGYESDPEDNPDDYPDNDLDDDPDDDPGDDPDDELDDGGSPDEDSDDGDSPDEGPSMTIQSTAEQPDSSSAHPSLPEPMEDPDLPSFAGLLDQEQLNDLMPHLTPRAQAAVRRHIQALRSQRSSPQRLIPNGEAQATASASSAGSSMASGPYVTMSSSSESEMSPLGPQTRLQSVQHNARPAQQHGQNQHSSMSVRPSLPQQPQRQDVMAHYQALLQQRATQQRQSYLGQGHPSVPQPSQSQVSAQHHPLGHSTGHIISQSISMSGHVGATMGTQPSEEPFQVNSGAILPTQDLPIRSSALPSNFGTIPGVSSATDPRPQPVLQRQGSMATQSGALNPHAFFQQAIYDVRRNREVSVAPAGGQPAMVQFSLSSGYGHNDSSRHTAHHRPVNMQGQSTPTSLHPSIPAITVSRAASDLAEPRGPALASSTPTYLAPGLLQTPNRVPPPPNIRPPSDVPSYVAHLASKTSLSPLTNLTNKLSLASPESVPTDDIPIQIYMPKIILPHSHVESQDVKDTATDCILLGHLNTNTDIINIRRAIFLPAHVWDNMLNRVRREHADVLETYAPPPNHPRYSSRLNTAKVVPEEVRGPHRWVYERLAQMFALMTGCGEQREELLTKRWRTGSGPMTERERGSVWEGYGLYLDEGWMMGREERTGPGGPQPVLKEGEPGWEEAQYEAEYEAMRRAELEEMLAEEEDDSEDGGDGEGDEMDLS